MISQCAKISPNLGFQFCRLVVIERPNNLVLLGRDHFLPLGEWCRKKKHSFQFCWKFTADWFFANQKLDSAELKIDGIVMQNEGIKQGGLWPFLLRERSSMASGRILHLASTICQLDQKPSNYFSDPAPPCQTDSAFRKFISSYHCFNLSQ